MWDWTIIIGNYVKFEHRVIDSKFKKKVIRALSLAKLCDIFAVGINFTIQNKTLSFLDGK